jgi:hypothetical protein
MLQEATLFGCILGGYADDVQEQHNAKIIADLPKTVDFEAGVFLSSAIFKVPKRYPATLFYRRQVIHFAISYNHLETYWKEWLQEFEELLRRLYFSDAYLYLEGVLNIERTEYYWSSGFGTQISSRLAFQGGPRDFDEWVE